MNWIQYIWSKLPELNKLGRKDLHLGKLVARIHRKRSEIVSTILPLNQISPLHAIDRETALSKLKERMSELNKVKQSWEKQKVISAELLSLVLPSVSGIKVIKIEDGHYAAFEGNGRLYALKGTFSELEIEVDLYILDKDKKITRRVKKVLQDNGLSE